MYNPDTIKKYPCSVKQCPRKADLIRYYDKYCFAFCDHHAKEHEHRLAEELNVRALLQAEQKEA